MINSASIDALLRLSVIYRNLSHITKTNSGEQISIIRTLCTLLTLPQLESFRSVGEFIFDVASHLADDLPDDLRTHFLKTETQRNNDDPRISFLFGPVPSTDGWVGLVTSNNTFPPPGPISRPTTPPSRFGSGQQQQGSTRPQQRPSAPQRQPTLPITQKNFNAPVPFPLRRWELLPDQGNNTSGNDTAISLALFAARRVD